MTAALPLDFARGRRRPGRRRTGELPANGDATAVIPLLQGSPEVIGYRRVSKPEQGEDWKASLSEQTHAVVAWALRNERLFDTSHFFEDRFSAETFEHRPAFSALYRYCEAHPRESRAPGSIVVLCASRFGRPDDPEESAYQRVRFRKVGWEVVYAQTDVPSGGRFNTLVRAAADIGASTERAEIVKRALSGGYNAARLGHWQGLAPIGYRRCAMKDGHRIQVLENGFAKPADRYCVLVPGPEAEVDLVRYLFAKYIEPGQSLDSLLDAVNERRAEIGDAGAPLRDDLIWSRTAMRLILANPVYMGTVRYGRRPAQGKGKRHVVRPESGCVVVPDAHPAIVERDAFERVQAKFAQNQVHRRGVRTVYALSGLIRCATCGSFLVGGGGGRPGPSGEIIHQIYRCAGADRRPRGHSNVPTRLCPPPFGTVARAKLERLVVEAMATELARPDVVAGVRAALEEQRRAGGAHDPEARSRRIEGRLTDLLARRANLLGAIERGVVTDDVARDRLAAIETERSRLKAERDKLLGTTRERMRTDDSVERLVAHLLDFPALAPRLAGDQLRALIAPWIAEAVFDKARRRVELQLRRIPLVSDGATQQPAAVRRGRRLLLSL